MIGAGVIVLLLAGNLRGVRQAGLCLPYRRTPSSLRSPAHRVIPEWFGGGTLPRKELHEAAEQVTANQAGLIAVGKPTIEKGWTRR